MKNKKEKNNKKLRLIVFPKNHSKLKLTIFPKNCRAALQRFVVILLWIIFFVILVIGVSFLIKVLTGEI